ncbi:MAG TPA: acyl-CoA carboxylase subunit beta [bacterium]|nr:acyl-CoA carboxylase subunit beta [bacterium]HMW36712.1 acyl-CoA carboxylase subunit beta [bacterium]HMZ03699.1 acyl-CoA carboxylase subunit beta [bacterium]HNE83540.1 acyl-CoA carboxylase subunit beta [bacterium]HNH30074.1 acyl-CoA carboxylase subunit beta [bacterium]
MPVIGSPAGQWNPEKYQKNRSFMERLLNALRQDGEAIKRGGGQKNIDKQHEKGRLTARERIVKLLDPNAHFMELGLFAAYEMYTDFGGCPSAGCVSGIGLIHGKETVIVAHDATVKAGAHFEMTVKKTLRAQEIAMKNFLPIVYLVDSAGVFLPLQDQVFPDENHFGRIFYNNARMSAMGITQVAAVMGPCVAGGAYLPVMCDKFIMVQGASLFLAGPALVKAAIGQVIDAETLGGATTHNAISGTADYHEPNDGAALDRIRDILSKIAERPKANFNKIAAVAPQWAMDEIAGILPEGLGQYDMREIIARLIDGSDFNEYKATYGKTVVCGTARVGGYAVGFVANQKLVQRTVKGEMQMGGVMYNEAADKAARFVMNCNQDGIPLIFMHDVNGFMVGRDAEYAGIAKDGAKLVNAVANSVVPKITIVIGGSYGAGNYAMCGKAYDPRFIFAWPTANISVMGGAQAASTITEIRLAGKQVSEEEKKKLYEEIRSNYEKQGNPRYAAARLWVDAIIEPTETRDTLIRCLDAASNNPNVPPPNFGVLQV